MLLSLARRFILQLMKGKSYSRPVGPGLFVSQDCFMAES